MKVVAPEPRVESSAETLQLLTGLSRGLFGRIEPALIAQHLLAVTHEADWAVRRAALQALARRYRFATRDALSVCERPLRGEILGRYATQNDQRASNKAQHGGSKRGPRPYVTQLLSTAPLRMSCSCADFVRSSLGLCKHGLAVLETLQFEGELKRALPAQPTKERELCWDATQQLHGEADRLARISYVHRGKRGPVAGFVDGRPDAAALAHPAQRLAWIDALDEALDGPHLEFEPAVRTLLSEERARVSCRDLDGKRKRRALASLKKLSRTLYPYQLEGVSRFFSDGRLLLADDMGLGKTTQAIASCHGLFATGEVKRGLIIVPTALKPQWQREWETTTSTPLWLVEGTLNQRVRAYEKLADGFVLMGYEQLVRDIEWVQALAPQLVVLDEAQRIKNWATKSAAYVKLLSPTYRLVLTGTPMENRLDELASIMDFVDDIALEPKWRLTAFHGVVEEGGTGLSGAKNLDVLRERLAGSMLRRVRREVLAQLPARVDTRVPVELTEVQREAHDELRAPIARLASRASRRPLTPQEFIRLMQLLATQRMICNGMVQLRFDEEWPRISGQTPTPALLDGLFAPKLSALRTLVEQIVVGQRRKAVVFSQWRSTLRSAAWAVSDLLAEQGMRSVFFTGAESSAARERAVVEFHEDPGVSVMFLSDAGGVGLNLQRAASCCINLELPWNPAVLEQRIGRIYRLGQELPVDIYNLVSEEGIEGRIAQLLAKKGALFNAVFDGTSDAVQFEVQDSFVQTVHKLVDLTDASLAAEDVGDDDELAVRDVELPAAATLEGERSVDTASTAVGDAPLPAVCEADVPAPSDVSSAGLTGRSVVTPHTAEAVQALTRPGLTVTALADGGLRVEASPQLAAQLARLLASAAFVD